MDDISDLEPRRVQLSRRKGWRMPPNTVKVDRTSKWGNPFVVGELLSLGYFQRYRVAVPKDAAEAVALFRKELMRSLLTSDASVDVLLEIRGKNLACWCALVNRVMPTCCLNWRIHRLTPSSRQRRGDGLVNRLRREMEEGHRLWRPGLLRSPEVQ